jgi:hypothetical protein
MRARLRASAACDCMTLCRELEMLYLQLSAQPLLAQPLHDRL